MSSSSANLSLKKNQKSIFKCERHSSIISEKLQEFYDKDELCDTVVNAGKGQNCVIIHAHRTVLCALSEYFLEKSRETHRCELNNIEPSTQKLIIDFMYSGSIELSIETVEGILRAACFLKIKTLQIGCCEFIEKNSDSSKSSTWRKLAEELGLTILREKLSECTNTSKKAELLQLSVNELKKLLFHSNPKGDLEEDIFLSLVKWINYDKMSREQFIFELLSMVRFKNLTPKFIVENVATVFKTAESYKLIFSWLKWHLSPETRSIDHEDKLAVIQISDDTNEIRVQTYNAELDSWSIEKQITLQKNKNSFSTIVIDDKLFVVGGKDCGNNCATNSVECLDMDTFEWTELRPMNKSRCFCQLADLKGYLCVFDGCDNEEFEASVEIYNLFTYKWHHVDQLKATKKSSIASHNGILYILDFYNGSLQSYDVSTNECKLQARIEKEFLSGFGFAAVQGFLYIMGGKLEKTAYRFNLSTNAFDKMAPLLNVYSNIKSTVFENKIVICGVHSNGLVVIEEYNLETNTRRTLSPFCVDGSYKTSLILSAKIKK